MLVSACKEHLFGNVYETISYIVEHASRNHSHVKGPPCIRSLENTVSLYQYHPHSTRLLSPYPCKPTVIPHVNIPVRPLSTLPSRAVQPASPMHSRSLFLSDHKFPKDLSEKLFHIQLTPRPVPYAAPLYHSTPWMRPLFRIRILSLPAYQFLFM